MSTIEKKMITMFGYRTVHRGGVAVAIALTAAVALTACASWTPGGDTIGSEDLPDDVTMADARFTQMMIPHHEQAIEMADIVLDIPGVEPEVVALAEDIKSAQGPEIAVMTSWLGEWGLPPMGDLAEGHSGGHGMDGLMSEDDLDALATASGPEASRLFLTQMIEHHEGAIDMAEQVIDDGTNSDVRALAQQIIVSQAAEIELMQDLLR